jgi:hypothetical protein
VTVSVLVYQGPQAEATDGTRREIMIINHVFIGRGPVKASDLFNVLTWASIGHTVNLYVAHPDKQLAAEQHTYASLFNLKQDIGGGMTSEYHAEHLFALVGGPADRVKLISLPATLANHGTEVPAELNILKFLTAASVWWPSGTKMNDAILERVFTAVDATKFYLSATKQGLTCDMKVAPTSFLAAHVNTIAANFISFQRGNAGAAGFENQLSGSMCAPTAEPRVTYAAEGKAFGDGFGSKSVDEAARYFEKITAVHGKAMQKLVTKKLGVDSTTLEKKVVTDPQSGWTGPVVVYKHPRDQSWAGRTLTESEKTRAKRDIDDMTKDALKLVQQGGTLGAEVYAAMVEISKLPGFNIYA